MNATPRKQVARFQGKGICRWCGEKVKPPRRSWCSDTCVDEYLVGDPTVLRRKVLARDKGVCAGCGRDCVKLAARIEGRLQDALRSEDGKVRMRAGRWRKLLLRIRPSLVAGFHLARALWDADHVVPLVEGGANTLENTRTLCIMCHRDETRALAKRRAVARRPQLALFGGDP